MLSQKQMSLAKFCRLNRSCLCIAFSRSVRMPSKVLDDVDFFRKPLPRPTRSIKGMECLIPVINKLRDVFDRTGGGSSAIELPQIVVLGSQVRVNLEIFI